MNFAVSQTIGNLADVIDNIPNNIKEAISRSFTDSYQDLKFELESQFGDAIRYANFDVSFSGNSYSINITNLNEFVTMNQSGSDASQIASFAETYMAEKIKTALRQNLIGGI